MKQTCDIHGILFNFSGTLDTEGSDWFDLIWKEYREIGIPVNKNDYLTAHEFAETEIIRNRLIKPEFNFYLTLHTKLSLQIEYLVAKRLLSDNQSTQQYAQRLASLCYNMAIMHVKQNELVIKQLVNQYRLGLVAQSYGNQSSILSDFGLEGYFTSVIESNPAKAEKSNGELFRQSVEALKLTPAQTLCVSNSLNHDLVPAQGIGCSTAWLSHRSVSASKRISNYHIRSLTELNTLLSTTP